MNDLTVLLKAIKLSITYNSNGGSGGLPADSAPVPTGILHGGSRQSRRADFVDNLLLKVVQSPVSDGSECSNM